MRDVRVDNRMLHPKRESERARRASCTTMSMYPRTLEVQTFLQSSNCQVPHSLWANGSWSRSCAHCSSQVRYAFRQNGRPHGLRMVALSHALGNCDTKHLQSTCIESY